MVTPQGQVKIMDFGLAQLADQSRLTKTATFLGTPAYMSPEQAERKPTDTRTDIWSLGVVLYEMISGRLPFEGETEHGVLYGIVNSQPEPLTAVRVGVPVELDRIVGKAMAKNPAERYQHADEMLVDLAAAAKPAPSGESTLAKVAGAASSVRSRPPLSAYLLTSRREILWPDPKAARGPVDAPPCRSVGLDTDLGSGSHTARSQRN